MAEEIVITEGSDLDFQLLFVDVAEDGTESPTDLTGATFELYQTSALLSARLSYSFEADRLSGIVNMTLLWDAAWDAGLPSAEDLEFRGRVTIGGRKTSSERVRLVFK